MSALLLGFIGLPAAAGAVLALTGRRADRVAPTAAVVVAAVVLAAAGAAAVLRPGMSVPFMAGAEFGLSVDALTAVLLPAVAGVTFLVLLYAAAAGSDAPARFHGLMLIFTSAVLITLTAATLPALLFAWEIMGAASYALIGFQWREARRVSSGLTAFLATRTADLGLYVAAGAAMASGSSMALAGLTGLTAPWRDVAAAGILVAGLGKAAQLPFSFWLSRAMDGPSAVSALLHSAAMVAMGGYLLLRVAPLLAATGWAATAAAWAGAATAVLLGVVALGQRDLKQLLAASTAAQLGFVVLAAGVGNAAGGAAHLVAHAATKSGLFLAAGAWLAALGTKQLEDLRGAGRRWPVLGAGFTVAALSLGGIAPLALWATKDNVLTAALERSAPLYLAGLTGSALAAAYAAKALILIWKQALPGTSAGYDTEETGTRKIVRWQTVPVLVLAAGAAAGGLLVLAPGGRVLGGMLGNVAQSGPLELTLSGALALAVAALVWKYHARLPVLAAARDWLGMEQAAHRLIVKPVLAVSDRLARFDDAVLGRAVDRAAAVVLGTAAGAASADRVLDRGVEKGATATSAAAGRATALDEGIDDGVRGLARLIRRGGAEATRPQTGQLHQYYVQAAVVLVAAAVLLILVR